MLKTLYYSFRWTLLGAMIGGLTSGVLIAWSAATNDRAWPIRLLEVNAWFGLHVFGDSYEGFPVISSVIWPNAVLVLSGSLQWSILGLALDAIKRWIWRPTRLHS